MRAQTLGARKTESAVALSIAAIAIVASSQAQAQTSSAAGSSSASTTFTVTGVAPQVCQLSSPAVAGDTTNATFSSSSNSVTLTKFIDPVTAYLNDASLTVRFEKAMCNYNAYLSLTSSNGGMTSSDAKTPASGDFITTVPYTVTADWGSVKGLVLDTAITKKVSAQAAGANTGALSLTFQTKSIAKPVVQGSYADVVTVKVAAQM